MMNWRGYALSFEAARPWAAPEFAGSMLRGAFGHALRRLACVMRLRACDGCPLEHACVYTTLFETRPTPGAGVMTRYERAPHPFVFVVGLDEPPSPGPARLQAGLRLFGEATRAAPFALRALEEAAAGGLGPARTSFRLTVAPQDPADAPAPWPRHVRLRFVTPLRMKRDGRLVTPEALTAPDLIMALVRRLGLLMGFFGGGTAGLDFRALKAAAAEARLADADLAWRDLARRSARQAARLGIGGVTGTATLDLGPDPALARLMAWSPVLHVGKGASMGLGRVEALGPA